MRPSSDPDLSLPNMISFVSTLPEMRLTTSLAVSWPVVVSFGGGRIGDDFDSTILSRDLVDVDLIMDLAAHLSASLARLEDVWMRSDLSMPRRPFMMRSVWPISPPLVVDLEDLLPIVVVLLIDDNGWWLLGSGFVIIG